MKEIDELNDLISQEMQIVFPEKVNNLEQLKDLLALRFNELINTDFNRLIQLLYSRDVDEIKLKRLLDLNKTKDAGEMMAELVIERQLQKIRSRQDYKRDENISDDEKW